MKKSFILIVLVTSILIGCKGAGNVEPVFDIDNVNFAYSTKYTTISRDWSDDTPTDPFMIYKKVSFDKEHYFFCLHNIIDNKITVKYNDDVIKEITLDKDPSEDYFNGKLDIADVDTFSDYMNEAEVYGNKLKLVILPVIHKEILTEVEEEIDEYESTWFYGEFKRNLNVVPSKKDNVFLTIHSDELNADIEYTVDQSSMKKDYRWKKYDSSTDYYKLYNFTDFTDINNVRFSEHSPFYNSVYRGISQYFGYSYYDDIFNSKFRENKNVINTLEGILEIPVNSYDTLYELKNDVKVGLEKTYGQYGVKAKYDLSDCADKLKNIAFSYTGRFDKFQVETDDFEDEWSWLEYKYKNPLYLKFHITKVSLFDCSNSTYTEIPLESNDYTIWDSSLKDDYADLKTIPIYYWINSLQFSPYENKIIRINDEIGFDFTK